MFFPGMKKIFNEGFSDVSSPDENDYNDGFSNVSSSDAKDFNEGFAGVSSSDEVDFDDSLSLQEEEKEDHDEELSFPKQK